MRLVPALGALALAFFASGCSGSNNGDVTLTIGSRDFPEQVLLGQIYAQALEGAGYKVKQRDLGQESTFIPEELKEGLISGYPEHLGVDLNTFFHLEVEEWPEAPSEYLPSAKANFEKEGLTEFPPTPYSLGYVVGLLRTEADRRHLKTLSQLRTQSERMTLGEPSECHVRADCLEGLEEQYRIYFEKFRRIDFDRRYQALEDHEVDASILYSTDGRLATEGDKFTVLEDDKHLVPPGNTIFITTPQVVEEAGGDFEDTIVAAQKGLTLPTMQRLMAEVELEKKEPAKVAAGYLNQIGLAD